MPCLCEGQCLTLQSSMASLGAPARARGAPRRHGMSWRLPAAEVRLFRHLRPKLSGFGDPFLHRSSEGGGRASRGGTGRRSEALHLSHLYVICLHSVYLVQSLLKSLKESLESLAQVAARRSRSGKLSRVRRSCSFARGPEADPRAQRWQRRVAQT